MSAAYDWSTTEPSWAVVQAVAVATDTDPTELVPLYDSVDTDALDALLLRARNGNNSPVSVSFSFAGRSVTVDSDGDVVVRPSAE